MYRGSKIFFHFNYKQMSYYNVKVSVSIESDTGKVKKNTEQYLVEAESVTEAEAKMYKDFEGYSGDWEVTSTVKTKIIKVVE
jgi:deoxyribodipyrimidine photolyase